MSDQYTKTLRVTEVVHDEHFPHVVYLRGTLDDGSEITTEQITVAKDANGVLHDSPILGISDGVLVTPFQDDEIDVELALAVNGVYYQFV